LTERRAYDATARRARSAERRALVLTVARRRFLDRGYGATSLREIAEEAGVSLEFIHKAFEGKAGLVRALYDESLVGPAPVPPGERSDEAQEHETSPRALMNRFGALTAEVTPLVAPMQLLIRDAAAGGDPGMAALWEEEQNRRYERMLANARRVEARGFLRAGVTAEHAADVFWAFTGPDLHVSLVVRRRWSQEEYARFVADSFAAALLD
jgi:AcrR family transcriptional regulator